MPSNNARIAKNTILLYFRQILILLVSLYTVRVVLETLGVEDYGIFNVVSGVVLLFAFLPAAMASATRRFLNFALGQNDMEQARNVYSVSLILHALIAALIILLAQTVGLWFFHTWLNIPSERQAAAFIVYQLSIMITAMGVLQVPYNATIIAYEKMSFFAALSLIEVLLRLGIVFLLPLILLDKLIAYAAFICIAVIVIFLVHKIYCNRTFKIARFRYCTDKNLFGRLLGFFTWSAFGEVANVSRVHGTNMLVNIFHGVTVNAAMGIATQVNAAVYQFLSSFQTVFNPQIIKLYSAKEYDHFMRLVFRTSKISFCLLLFFVLPLYINAEFVLRLWLGNAPEYTVAFIHLVLSSSLLMAIAGPLLVSIQATGDIKKYQLITSCLIFANLPLSLFFLWIGFSPVWVLITRIGLDALILVWQIFFLGRKIKLPVRRFFCEVVVPIFIIMGTTILTTVFIYNLFIGEWSKLIASCIISTITIACLMYCIGLNKQEKILFWNWIRTKLAAG